MKCDLNFGPEMNELGRTASRELILNDYGKESRFDGIGGHGPQEHHGGRHEQVNLFKTGIPDSGVAFRFFENQK